MTTIFTLDELKKISVQYTVKTQPDLIEDKNDRTFLVPQWLGKGYKRKIKLRQDIYIVVHNYQLSENLMVNSTGEIEETVEIAFKLSLPRDIPQHYRFKEGICCVIGKNYQGGIFQEISHIPAKGVDIHINESFLQSFLEDYHRNIPDDLRSFFTGQNLSAISSPQRINPAMKMTIEQIINCPFQGITKQLYLEAKVLELIALKIEVCRNKEQIIHLKKEDLEAIHQAEKILLNNYHHPPSLSDLARQVGLNTRKLKQGFRQVFKTTVFGYLYNHRMNIAQNLLKEQEHISIVAQSVGYASPTSFNAAFQKQFGVSPKNFQLAHRL